MRYDHLQTGKINLFILVPTAILLGAAWQARANPQAVEVLLAITLVLLFTAAAFQSLLIRDEGDNLVIRYGPLPLFFKRFPYAQMTAVESSRSSFLDGWGIHYRPGQGWIYNLWGFDCVQIQMGRKTVRLGTDDVAGLVGFLRTKIVDR